MRRKSIAFVRSMSDGRIFATHSFLTAQDIVTFHRSPYLKKWQHEHNTELAMCWAKEQSKEVMIQKWRSQSALTTA